MSDFDALEIEALWGDEEEAGLPEFEEQPLLVVDTDLARTLARQREMMDFAFEGIGEERKPEKQMGLAMQQLDIEQRHALRLLLLYREPEALAAHLRRCLEDPAYGYGERGDNGRTIAQAMAAVWEGDLETAAREWLAAHREFQEAVLGGVAFSFLSLYHYADVDSFIPLLQRLDEHTWRLGVEGQGKYRDFSGPLEKIWPQICDTNVQWLEEDNSVWLNDLKRRAARLPDSILRAARADRLRKERERVEVSPGRVALITERDEVDWPRQVVYFDREGTGLLSLSRLSGHNFYELSWDGGLHVRYFEISGTTRQKVPFEHIELATALADALADEAGLAQEPVGPEAVEAAYLRRMKAEEACIGPPEAGDLPKGIEGAPKVAYRVGPVRVLALAGGVDVALASVDGREEGILLRRDDKRGVITALPVVRGRPRRGQGLMSTPLAEVDLTKPAWLRAVLAWAAWLAWALYHK